MIDEEKNNQTRKRNKQKRSLREKKNSKPRIYAFFSTAKAAFIGTNNKKDDSLFQRIMSYREEEIRHLFDLCNLKPQFLLSNGYLSLQQNLFLDASVRNASL